MSGAPPPPPPPSWPGPPASTWSSAPIGSGTVDSIAAIRRGIGWYRLYVLVSVVTGLLLAAASGIAGTPELLGSSVPPTATGDANATLNQSTLPAGAPGWLTGVVGLVGFVGIIFVLLGWLAWRGGIRDLGGSALDFGPNYSAEVELAEGDYRRTVYLFVLAIVVAIVLAVVVVALAVGAVTSCVAGSNAGTTSSCLTVGSYNTLRGEIIVAAVGATFVGVLINVGMYYFATRSLVGALAGASSDPIRTELATGRQLVLVGAVLGVASLAVFASPLLAIASVLGPAVALLGYSRLAHAYDTWLQNPPLPAPAPPRAGSVPPPPPPR